MRVAIDRRFFKPSASRSSSKEPQAFQFSMNRRRSNARRGSWDCLGIFLVLLTRKMPEVLAIHRLNDYQESRFLWSSPLDGYYTDSEENLLRRPHEIYNAHGRLIVYRNPISFDLKTPEDIDIPWRRVKALRAFSRPSENGPDGMYGVSRKTLHGFGQRSKETDEETSDEPMHNRTGVLEDASTRKAPSWNQIRRQPRNANDSNADDTGSKEATTNGTNSEEEKIRKDCVDMIMKLENSANICKLAKYMQIIVREIKRQASLIKFIIDYKIIEPRKVKKYSFNSIMNKSVRELTGANNRMKKLIDRRNKDKKPHKKPKKKPPKKRKTTPSTVTDLDES